MADALVRLGHGRAEQFLASDSSDFRRIGVHVYAQSRDYLDRVLLMDLDPHELVSKIQVAAAVLWCNLTVDQVRSRYEAMANDLGLMLAWRN